MGEAIGVYMFLGMTLHEKNIPIMQRNVVFFKRVFVFESKNPNRSEGDGDYCFVILGLTGNELKIDSLSEC